MSRRPRHRRIDLNPVQLEGLGTFLTLAARAAQHTPGEELYEWARKARRAWDLLPMAAKGVVVRLGIRPQCILDGCIPANDKTNSC